MGGRVIEKSRFSEEQIIGILKQHEAGVKTADVCREHGISAATAAAFHIFRAVEAAVHDYGVYVRDKPFTPREKKGGLGAYANCLKEMALSVDLRITGAIGHIASLYRNPTIHPEMHISNEEVIGTLNIAISVIDLVALDWKRREETPQKLLSEILPDDTKVDELIGDSDSSKVLPPKRTSRLLKGNNSGKERKDKVGKSRKELPPKI
jgi:hypothetical protein